MDEHLGLSSSSRFSFGGGSETLNRSGSLTQSIVNQSQQSSFGIGISDPKTPNRTFSSLKAVRGPYARPSVLDRDRRFSPYARKPMQIPTKRVASENPGLNLTSTAERIIQTLAKCATPVIDVKKSPIDSFKTLKPEFPNVRRENTGPPTKRACFDTTPDRSAILPADLPKLVPAKSQDNAQALLDEIFGEDVVAQETSGKNSEAAKENDDSNETFFDASGNIVLDNVKFGSWSVDKYLEKDDLDSSSDEDEDGNPYIKAPEVEKKMVEGEASSVTPVEVPQPQAAAVSQAKWECPTCMVSNLMESSTCVCCETANPNPSSSSKPVTSSKKTETPVIPSPFVFGFKSDFTPTTSVTTSTFKFGEKPSESTSLSSTKFRLGFNTGSNANSSEVSNNEQPATFTFGFPKTNDAADSKSKTGASPKTDPFEFAKKSAGEEVWECPSCMVFNKKSLPKCLCCQETQPQPKRSGNNAPTSSSTPKTPFGFSSPKVSSASPIGKEQISSPPKQRISFGLKPEDESSLETPVPEESSKSTSSPYKGFSFPTSQTSNQKGQEDVPKSSGIEPWKCNMCTATNSGSMERCAGCKQQKPRSVMPPPPTTQSGGNFEKYTFIFGDQAKQSKPDPTSTFNSGNFVPSTTSTSAAPPVTFGTSTFGSGFSFGQKTPGSTDLSSTTPVSSGSGFIIGSPTLSSSNEGLKRKVEEGTEASTASGFKFSDSEPKLKLKAVGTEAPSPAPNPGLKSGSVLDALKQPEFGNIGRPDVTTSIGTTAPSQAPTPTPSFSFPNITSGATAQIPVSTPGSNPVFQFGQNPSISSPIPAATPGFSFGQSNTTSTPMFGAPTATSGQLAQGGFQFNQPGLTAPAASQPGFNPNSGFNLTPNLNFAAQAWGAGGAAPQPGQPFTFQSQPSQSGPATPQRKFRKAVRRAK